MKKENPSFMKKLFSLFVAISVLSLSAEAQECLMLRLSQAEARAGDTADIHLTYHGVVPFVGFGFSITYDGAVLQPIAVDGEHPALASENVFGAAIEPQGAPGISFLGYTDDLEPVAGLQDGDTLYTIRFAVLASTAWSPVRFADGTTPIELVGTQGFSYAPVSYFLLDGGIGANSNALPQASLAGACLGRPDCNDPNSGAINLLAEPGAEPGTVAWSDPNSNVLSADLSADNLPAGTYFLEITGPSGPARTGRARLYADALHVRPEVTAASCAGPPDGSASLQVSDTGGGALAYVWSDGSTLPQLENAAAGSYSVTVTSTETGCKTTASVEVGQRAAMYFTGSTVRPVVCDETNSGAINPSLSGPDANGLIYEWGNGALGASRQNLTPGSYAVTVSNSAGCSRSRVFEVPRQDGLHLNAQQASQWLNCINPSGFIDLAPPRLSNFIEYAWSNFQTTEDIAGLAPGNYSVSVYDPATGCSGTKNFAFGREPIETTPNVVCTAGPDGQQLTVMAVAWGGGSSVPPFRFDWSGGYEIDSGTFHSTILAAEGESYSVTITDVLGCQEVMAPILAECLSGSENGPGAPPADNPPATIESGQAAFSMSALATSGSPGEVVCVPIQAGETAELERFRFSFSWDPSMLEYQSIEIVDPSFENTVFYRDFYPHLGIDWEYTGAPLALDTPTTAYQVCFEILADKGNAFLWNSPYPLENRYDSPAGQQILVFRENAVRINCDTPLNVSVEEASSPTLPGSQDGFIRLSTPGGSPVHSFEWIRADTVFLAGNHRLLQNLGPGTYSVRVEDRDNCTALIEGITLESAVSIQDTTICPGDSLQLSVDAPGAVSYSWEPAFLLSCGDCPNPVTEPLFGDQTFMVTTTDALGAETTTEINVFVRNYLDFGLLPFSNSPVCEGDTLAFNPNVIGGQSYTWADPNQVVFSTAPFPLIPDVSPADAGTYSLDLIDDIGCEVGASFDVQVFPSFLADISATPATCNGLCDGAASLAISGGTPPYLISWDEGLNWSSDTSLAGLCAGTYPVWVMDENCLQKLEATIVEAEPLSASFNIGPPFCPGGDITIEIFNFSGGAGSGTQYFYSINGGQTFQPTFDVPWPIPATTASIVIRDDAGCQSTYPIDVMLPEPIRADISITNASCISQDDGRITINAVTGGTPPYTYFLDGIQYPQIDFPLVVDDYSLVIMDANACTAEYPIVISTNPIDAITNDTVICAGELALLQADAPGAVAAQWSPATGLAAPDQLSTLASPTVSTTYRLTVVDDEGCMGTDSVQVAVLAGIPCREEWRDTLSVGESGLWCSVASQFGSPIPYGITELGCGNGLGIAGIDADSLGPCVAYTGLAPGQDTLCLTICELIDTANCWEAFLYLTVTETLVWPGDTDSSGLVDQYDLLNIGLGYGTTGPIRPDASLEWLGQPAPLWGISTPASGIDYRHIDADGNGAIDTGDTLAISQNWGLAWEDGNGRPGAGPSPTTAGGPPFYLHPDTLIEGATMQLPLILGTEETPAAGVYGLAFSLYFDESVVQDGSAALVLSDSWLGDPAQNLIYMQRRDDGAGRIDAGITRIDGIDADGYGPIGDLFITIEDDILARNLDLEALFEIRDVRIINYQEELLPVDTPPTIAPVLSSRQELPLPGRLRLSPNPARRHFRLSGPEMPLEQVQLLNALGQPVRSWQRPEPGKPFSLEGVVPGLYLVKAKAGNAAGACWLVVE